MMKEPWLVVATREWPEAIGKGHDVVGVTVVDCGAPKWMATIISFGDAVNATGLAASKIREVSP